VVTHLRRCRVSARLDVSCPVGELVAEQEASGPPEPSLETAQRAIRRDVTPGERAGLGKSEREAWAQASTTPLDELVGDVVR
jgi:hypothetical protein